MEDVELSAMDKSIISKARWDGGWPKVVCLGPGCLELAYNQEEFDALMKRVHFIELWIYGCIAVLAACPVALLVFLSVR